MLGIYLLVSFKHNPPGSDEYTYTHHSDLIQDSIKHVDPQVKVVLCLPVCLYLLV